MLQALLLCSTGCVLVNRRTRRYTTFENNFTDMVKPFEMFVGGRGVLRNGADTVV